MPHDKLSKILRKKRKQNGSINFKSTEVKFILDKENNPIDICFKEHFSTNHLIEEFMLLANNSKISNINTLKYPNIFGQNVKMNTILKQKLFLSYFLNTYNFSTYYIFCHIFKFVL